MFVSLSRYCVRGNYFCLVPNNAKSTLLRRETSKNEMVLTANRIFYDVFRCELDPEYKNFYRKTIKFRSVEWEVAAIIGRRIKNKKMQYHVVWGEYVGYKFFK